MVRSIATAALYLILGESCYLWLEKKHPAALKVMCWLLLPLAAIGVTAAGLIGIMLNTRQPYGMRSSLMKMLPFIGLMAAAVACLVLLALVLRLLVKLLWHPTPEMQIEIEQQEAELAAEAAKRIRKREMKHWICPDCGTENHVMREHCSRCNHRWAEY